MLEVRRRIALSSFAVEATGQQLVQMMVVSALPEKYGDWKLQLNAA